MEYGSGGIRVQSHVFPELTRGLHDPEGNRLYYTQGELAALISFAKDRGIRIIPELEQVSVKFIVLYELYTW